ncbi:predicted protein [Chaetomium globosum CBS 148.51]|jgi:hypothetical protein|uniref:Uncharacterized protein n=1 Tax=Chaetomium globosum (strain ATCC 6205 / CBS 148.51 / DSM 1962 / NBRC 6347 / NRRL 1970) TaxID=306901 RepID=Q2H4Q6_CHAGB|nr:uncharacterized protein CHGG_06359 [Chaetomium globosum CBS 148.51]EAQ89740.1 predicted protein [Chaetomium globosum CBS 148.51]
MPQLDEVSYSREATIAAVREYYRFLTRMYLNECYVAEPPEEGWPEINTEALSGLGKTDEVISLLRHLPYIRASSDWVYEGAPGCRFADWRDIAHSIALGELPAEDLRSTTEGGLPESISPHVVGLTDGGFRNLAFLLDTKLGIIYWDDCHSDIKNNPPREPIIGDEYEDDSDVEIMNWRLDESVAWTIPDFFEILKGQFRQLNYVPISPRKVYHADVIEQLMSRAGQGREGLPMVQAVYRAHGWPDMERYRKQDCLKAVQDLFEERCPDYADSRRYDDE